MSRYIFSVFLAMSMANLFAWADSDDEYNRIARISFIEGDVSFQHTSDVDWTAASVNLPLQPGDRIYTGPQGRAEIEFDEGSVYRLAERTDIQILSLKEDCIQLRVLTGLSTLTVSSGLEFEMDTPASAFLVLREGSYRFDTRENGDTDAIVRKGALDAVSHRFVRRVESGERIFVTADENSSYRVTRYDTRDAWDEWNDRRNADLVARDSRKYLPGDVYVGVSDLDRYGRWVNVESYGTAWVPFSVDVSWSPYSVGRWCYRPVWGWTWVSYEPWGWLPYHYGRWYRSASYGWCWLPGPSFSFHFWSPGLVSFYYGPSWVSWCPLGPGDYYSINNYYYNRVRYRHLVVDVERLYHRKPGDLFNRHVRGAFRTADLDRFRNGGFHDRRDGREWKRDDEPWRHGSLVQGRLAIHPTSRSYSADPDRRVARHETGKARPAMVLSQPTVDSRRQTEYVRITNRDVLSKISRRTQSSDRARPSVTARSSDNNVEQRRSGDSVRDNRTERGPDRSGDRRNETEYRENTRGNKESAGESGSTGRDRSRGDYAGTGSARNGDSQRDGGRGNENTRTYHLNPPRQAVDRSASSGTSTERDSSGGKESDSSTSGDSVRTYHLNPPRQAIDRSASSGSSTERDSSGGKESDSSTSRDSVRTYHLNPPRQTINRSTPADSAVSRDSFRSSEQGRILRSVPRSISPVDRSQSGSGSGESIRSDTSPRQSNSSRSSQTRGQASPRVSGSTRRESANKSPSSTSSEKRSSESKESSGSRSEGKRHD
jgi:hypothetical protein